MNGASDGRGEGIHLNLGRVNLAAMEPVRLPRMVPVRQRFDARRIDPEDMEAIIGGQFRREDVRGKITPGMRIAVGVGSRGIENLALIVRAVVQELKKLGAVPFIVPAMGSHGGGRAEGQERLLAGYGIHEENVGAPVRASMDTVYLGTVLDGVEVHFDRIAYEQADGIIVVARIKPHTDFKGPIESGILKMLGIGLGKHKGASYLHKFGMERFGTLLPAVGALMMERTPILGGVGIVEDAYHETAHIEFVPKEQLPHREEQLLAEAKRLMPRFWLNDIDVLIVDEIGKNISGSGMDPNIIGRSGASRTFGEGPAIRKIVVGGLTEETKGSAVGIGLADFTTRRVVEQIDFATMYTNVITAMEIGGGKLPLVLHNDEEAISVAVCTAGRREYDQVKVVRIKHTLALEDILVSENLLPEVEAHPMMEATGAAREWKFDATGHLIG
ncbi:MULTISPECIES: hypothetical protein [Paenibacillus]|uniref:DUF2088 domain-containing protein n=1 Tax=Paenibacillus validus TaxID=44253 RepID=A0A7X3CUF6_9BACL|nr:MULTISPECIES: hypothetical protein [Paenibacillus]MUG72054.1 hypothetical protein [Paenibacillus validus]